MTKNEVIELLEKNKNERGIANWKKMGGFDGLKSYGMGLTQLKRLAKRVRKDHELALELWESDIYDAKLLATMIDEPRKVTREQVEEQIENLSHWGFSHAYVTNLLPKVPFLKELADDWMESEDDIRRRCGYLSIYQLAKDDKKIEDEYFEPIIERIRKGLQSEENFVRDAMNNALLMIGQRSRNLNARALSAARSIGKVEVDYGDNSCEPVDVEKHLSSERIQRKVMKV